MIPIIRRADCPCSPAVRTLESGRPDGRWHCRCHRSPNFAAEVCLSARSPLPTIAFALALVIALFPLSTLAAEPQAPVPDRRFGVVEAFWRPDQAARLGVGWQRIIFYWRDLQRNGSNDWNDHYFPDALLDSELAAGRQIVGLLIGTPGWAAQVRNGDPRNVPSGLDLPLDHPENHWARFVRTIVERYRGKIDHWIVWNEPDVWGEVLQGSTWNGSEAEYYLLLKTAYRAAKSVNPSATILFSGLTYWWDARYNREQYLERVLRVADDDPTARDNGYYFDVLPMHLYNVVPYVPFVIGRYRAILAAHGLSKPLWINETNVVPFDDPAQPLDRAEARSTLQEQASFLIQTIALALAYGVERISVYKMLDDAVSRAPIEPFGLTRQDGSVRPAFEAYRTAIRHFSETRSATAFDVGNAEGVLLDRGERTTITLWNVSGRPEPVAVEAPVEEARLVEPTGAEQVIRASDGRFTLDLPGATREWPSAELAEYTMGGKPAILVFEAPVEAVQIRTSTGAVDVRPGLVEALVESEAGATSAAEQPDHKDPVLAPVEGCPGC